jgi:hypothetical protein
MEEIGMHITKNLPKTKVCVLWMPESKGVFLISDYIFAPRRHELLMPGPLSHWAKLIFEKYYIWKLKRELTCIELTRDLLSVTMIS